MLEIIINAIKKVVAAEFGDKQENKQIIRLLILTAMLMAFVIATNIKIVVTIFSITFAVSMIIPVGIFINDVRKEVSFSYYIAKKEENEAVEKAQKIAAEIAEAVAIKGITDSNSFEGCIFSHGLSAYSGTHSAKGMIQNAMQIMQDGMGAWEVCCSTKHQTIAGRDGIGAGLYISGTVTLAANGDVFSHVENGVRIPHPDRRSLIVATASDVIERTDNWHNEFFVIPQEIRGAWISKKMVQARPKQAEEIVKFFECLGLTVAIVDAWGVH